MSLDLQCDNPIEYNIKGYMDDDGSDEPLKVDELKPSSMVYRNFVAEKRDYIGKLNEFLDDSIRGDEDNGKCRMIVDTVKSVFSSMLDYTGDDLIAVCNDVIDTIDGNLLGTAVDSSERVLLYRIKGDLYRYKWKMNDDDVTSGKEATKAYHEAFCICQWNFEPTDPRLLRLAIDYAVHLNDMDNPDQAATVLRRVVNSARDHLDENEMNDTAVPNKSSIESLLIDLNTHSERFKVIADAKPLRLFCLINERDPDTDEDFHEIIPFDTKIIYSGDHIAGVCVF